MQIHVHAAAPVSEKKPTRPVNEEWVKSVVQKSLDRFEPRLTRVEVHVKESTGAKAGHDKCCTIEAKLGGMPPMVVSVAADTVHVAVTQAGVKLQQRLQHDLDKRHGKVRKGAADGSGAEPLVDPFAE